MPVSVRDGTKCGIECICGEACICKRAVVSVSMSRGVCCVAVEEDGVSGLRICGGLAG